MASPTAKKPKVAFNSRRQSKRETERSIKSANEKTDDEFIKDYLNPSDDWTQWSHPDAENQKTCPSYSLSLQRMEHLKEEELDACFDLIEETSGDDYRNSAAGWHPAVKKKEMRSPDLRYLLIKTTSTAPTTAPEQGDGVPDTSIRGFVSMMPTFENGEAVVYVYEIHLKTELQRSGFGKRLMEHVRTVAESIAGVEKVMLTCFVSNDKARRFYEKLGFEKDDFSPRDRKLRGGKVVTSDYVILSRRVD